MQSNRLLRFSLGGYKRPQSASLLAQVPARNGVPPAARQVFGAFLSLDSEQPDLVLWHHLRPLPMGSDPAQSRHYYKSC